MKLTIAEINAAAGMLAGIKLNRITDKEVKAVLLKDYLALRKAAKEAEADREEIVRKFQEDWMEEIPAVEKFRKENKPVLGHLDYLEAEKDANKAISDIFSAEVEVDIKPVPTDDFVASCGDEELSLEQIAFLTECGLLEG